MILYGMILINRIMVANEFKFDGFGYSVGCPPQAKHPSLQSMHFIPVSFLLGMIPALTFSYLKPISMFYSVF